MLVKKDVLVLNGQKLVQGMQVHKQLMLKIMSEGIAAHHLLCLFVQLAIDKNQWLIKISPWPVIVTDRTEIERGSDTFQIATADLEQERSMTEQENMLLYGSEKQLGIYQITARDPEHDYRFMGLDYVEKKGITVTRADYDLIYAAPLTEKDTLDGIYERFNIQPGRLYGAFAVGQ